MTFLQMYAVIDDHRRECERADTQAADAMARLTPEQQQLMDELNAIRDGRYEAKLSAVAQAMSEDLP